MTKRRYNKEYAKKVFGVKTKKKLDADTEGTWKYKCIFVCNPKLSFLDGEKWVRSI